jgi:hypothetical protein
MENLLLWHPRQVAGSMAIPCSAIAGVEDSANRNNTTMMRKYILNPPCIFIPATALSGQPDECYQQNGKTQLNA